MATHAPTSTSEHLTTARELLDDVTVAGSTDPQVKAAAAAAHATLVLAEQVAAVRLVLAASAAQNGHAAGER
jgi:hypothetical protein